SGSDPTLEETRSYVYTYMNSYGEEGPPSPPSSPLLSIYNGNLVTVSNLGAAGPPFSLLLHMDGNLTDTGGDNHTPSASSIVGYSSVAEWGQAVSLGVFTPPPPGYHGPGGWSIAPSEIQYAANTDFNLSGGVSTVDFWLYMEGDLPGTIFSQATDANNYLNFNVVQLLAGNIIQGDALNLSIYASGTQTLNLTTGNLGRLAGVYHHIAVVENGTSYYIFLDGVLQATATSSALPANYSTSGLCIGALTTDGSTYTNGLYAFLDEFRVVKGTAEWTSNFTPASAPYSTSSIFPAIYNLQYINIYRTNQNASGTALFQLVAQVPITTTTY